jgi:pSer/pThr/pTyr-binding forkhead associated (FHA) protein
LASLVSRDGKRSDLKAGRVTTIGRSLDNDVVLQHKSVSRRHATIQWANRGFSLSDLDSSNGTWVRNRRITKLQLADRDIVRFGDVELVFENRARNSAWKGAPDSPEQTSRSSGRGRVRKTLGLLGVCAAAVVALFVLGLGATDLMVGRRVYPFNPAPRSIRVPDTTVDSKDGMAKDVGRDSKEGMAASDVGRAIIETDRKHAADGSWIAVDQTAQACNAGAIPADSIYCRVAYLGRHAEGKDLDRGPQTIAAADVAEFCTQGAIDAKSPVCAQASTASRSRLRP